MGIMHLSTVDAIRTGVVTVASYDLLPVPTNWRTEAQDIMQFELWASTDWTLGYSDDDADAVTIAADRVVVIAVRKSFQKNTTEIPGIYVEGTDINILAHALNHGYYDQNQVPA